MEAELVKFHHTKYYFIPSFQRFNWQGQGDCEASFECDQLEDTICNELATKLEFKGSIKQTYQQVCSSGLVNLGIIPSGEHLVTL